MNHRISIASVFGTIVLGTTVVFFALSQHAYAAITMLSEGDSGSSVSELQAFLATDSAIYPEGLITGYYGPLTASAVGRFQCARGIVCSGSAATTGYGRVGPRTLAAIVSLQGGGSGGVGGDVSAPIIYYPATVSTTSTSAVVSWTTSEAARHRVMYGTTWPFLYAIAPSVVSATTGTTALVVLPGLLPNTTYYYTRESIDLSGNIQWTVGESFRTSP